MGRGCALIDSRLDIAKICSDGRVDVDHAQLPAVFGGEKTFSHGLGQVRKCSRRGDGSTPKTGHRSMRSACPFRANKKTHALQQKASDSITSSARTSKDGGTVRPSALPVLRLITSSYLVGCSTGRSEGLVPLRILST